MKVLVLCAGFATRLYPLTEKTAKPLLKVGNKPILDHIMEKIDASHEITEAIVVTNEKFHADFIQWKETSSFTTPITLLNDQTTSNENRLGAVGDINFAIKQLQIDDDLLVIGGDNLFGFSLQSFTDYFKQQQTSIVAFCDLKHPDEVRNKFGVGILKGTKIIDFEEKPTNPKSTLASTLCYIFSKSDLHNIESILQQQIFDNPGDLIIHLTKNTEVHGFIFDEYWFDIGSFEKLEEARSLFEQTSKEEQ